MWISEVYNTLREVISQIDAQVQAVALEHVKDFDAAVETFNDGIIPFFMNSPSRGSVSEDESSEVTGTQTEDCPPLITVSPVKEHDVNGGNGDGNNEHVNMINLSGDVYSHGETSTESETEKRITSPDNVDMIVNQENDQEMPIDLNVTPVESSEQLADVAEMHETMKPTLFPSTDTASDVETENDYALVAAILQYCQDDVISVLDKNVSDARNNKKMLLSALDTVINLMGKVDRKEKAIQVANKEAATGGVHILNRVEELKQMLKHANQANQINAGEVYDEKTIVESELMMLQDLVLSLSDKRDKSLRVLDEMRQSLELRLAAAEHKIEVAQLEKLGKETFARKLLTEQECIMEKVMQESKILKQQTEDNLKLQKFLLDRSQVVDMLQEEIDIICDDVKWLKEKFDETGSFTKILPQLHCFDVPAALLQVVDQMDPKLLGDESSGTESETSGDEDFSSDETSGDEDFSSDETSGDEDFSDCESSAETEYEDVLNDQASGDDRKEFVDGGWDFIDSHEIAI